MTELNELFEQIFHAELKFKARADKLKQLAQSIELGKAEVLKTKEECRTKQGELAVKNNKLADLEAEVKQLTVRNGILQEQKDTLVKTKEELIQHLADVKKACDKEKQNFKKELTEFGCNYDLHGAGFKRRQEETKRKIELLQDELLLLKTELAEMDVQREEVQKLERELSKAEECLEQERAKSEDLQRLLSEQETEIKKLEEECNNVNQKFSKDPDFVRLQRELESCKACPEEAECEAARRQLRELQQKCYHHQMKRQLDRQKNGVQNKSLDLGRQCGHYNPYTCQYVPAPKPLMNNSINEGSLSNSILHSNSNNSGVLKQGLVQKEQFQEDNCKLVDDEWLMTGDEEYLHEDEWDMESLEDKTEDDITVIDDDWDNFDIPLVNMQQFSRCDSGMVKTSLTSSYKQGDSMQPNATKTGHPNYQQSKPTTSRAKKVVTGRSRPKSELQQNVTQSGQTRGQSISASLPRNIITKANQDMPRNRISTETIIPSAALITDSPDPDCTLRKRSGQSIYKAPGSKPTNDSLPKKAKKVRFHH